VLDDFALRRFGNREHAIEGAEPSPRPRQFRLRELRDQVVVERGPGGAVDRHDAAERSSGPRRRREKERKVDERHPVTGQPKGNEPCVRRRPRERRRYENLANAVDEDVSSLPIANEDYVEVHRLCAQ
jgi:hypothetical protein